MHSVSHFIELSSNVHETLEMIALHCILFFFSLALLQMPKNTLLRNVVYLKGYWSDLAWQFH